MVVVQKTNNMGRKLRVKKQKGKANQYFIGDKKVSEKEYVKTYTDAVNEGKKVNPDFKPTSVKEITSPATLKKRSGFKLKSGNKPSMAKLSGVSPTKKLKITYKDKPITKERVKKKIKREATNLKQSIQDAKIYRGFSAMGARLGLHSGSKGYMSGYTPGSGESDKSSGGNFPGLSKNRFRK